MPQTRTYIAPAVHDGTLQKNVGFWVPAKNGSKSNFDW